MKLISTCTLPMRKIITTCITIATLLFANGCANEINTNADEKEIMVVYGLIDPNDSIHHIRIHRAFLTNGESALEVAKDADEIFFDSLEVTIDEYDIGTSTPIFRVSYPLFKNTSLAKEPGIFSSENNIVYTLNQQLNENYLYRLTVKNKITGNIATAETRMVQNPKLITPSGFTTLFLINPEKTFSIIWSEGLNAKVYDVTFRFYWDEYDSASNQLLDSNKFIDWRIVQSKEINTSAQLRNNILGSNFYSFLGSQLPSQVGKYRIPKKIDFIYWGADENFYLYRKVNAPNIGIVQSKPEYTNISDGNFGLFASRNRFAIENVPLSQFMNDFLRTNEDTKKLKFR